MRSVQKSTAGHKPDTPSLVIDGKRRSLTSDVLSDGDKINALIGRGRNAGEIVARLDGLLALPLAARWAALDVVAAVPVSRYEVAGREYRDGLDAVLALRPGDDTRAQTAWLAAAREAIALFHPETIEVGANRVRQAAAALKIVGVRVDQVAKDVRAILARVAPGAVAAAVRVTAAVPGAPVGDAAVVPAGWTLSPTGIAPAGDAGPVLPAPVVITGRSVDVQRHVELVDLAWSRGGTWERVTADRKVVANKSAVLDLAAHGLPVHSGTAATLVRFLAEYEAANLGVMPAERLTGQTGWQGSDGRDGFLWGATLIPSIEKETDTNKSAAGVIRFRGADAGDDQLVDGFQAGGTVEGWRAGVSLIEPFPRVRLALYAACVPPLLPVLGSENFALDLCGPTSGGKTTALMAAGSVWGRPVRGAGGTVLHDWNGTSTFRERAAAVLNNLAFIVDDTKTARHPDEIAQMVFAFCQGRTRGRGTPTGVAQQAAFASVMLTSGEQPLISIGEHGGLRPRVLMLWGSPFGATNAATAAVVAQLRAAVAEHHGHAGPALVRHLIEHGRLWPAMRKKHREWAEEYATLAAGNPVAVRMCGHFAAITVASFVLHKAVDMPWVWEDPVLPLFAELTAEAGEADRAAAALRYVVGWATAHRRDFYSAGRPATDQPPAGWAGRWDRDGGDNPALADARWRWIGFAGHVLKRVIAEGGFEADATLRNWRDRGWLKCTAGRNQFRTRIGKDVAWLFAVRRAAAEQAGAM